MSDSAMNIAYQAERELNKTQKTQKPSDSTIESGVDANVEKDFPGATVMYGGDSTGRTIPPEQGGAELKSGRMTRDRDFEGPGGPEDKERIRVDQRGGDNDVPRGDVPRGQRGDKPVYKGE